MANEVKNDVALMQILGAIGNASYLTPFVTNRDDARKIRDAALHLINKLADKHQFSPTVISEVGRALKA